ncbi:MAG: ABC transporter ATP-binding protein [Acetobacteraceae bacterium]
MLEVRDLHAFYGESHILHGLSFTVSRGEVVTLIGRNGAGKTTTLKSIIGDIPDRRGVIRFENRDVGALAAERIAACGIGYVPEDRGIFATLSVLENLTISSLRGPAAWKLDQVFDLFPALSSRLHQRASRLSGGEQQMLAIARPLVMGSRFLLLDEPTEGLAPVIIDLIGGVLRRLKEQGLTILLVEQNLRFATAVADRHHLMVNGEIVKTLTNAEIARQEDQILEHLGV